MNHSETVHASFSWPVDVHVTLSLCFDNFLPLLKLCELRFFSASNCFLSVQSFSASKDLLSMYLKCSIFFSIKRPFISMHLECAIFFSIKRPFK